MTDATDALDSDHGRTSDAPLGAVDPRHQARILALQLLYELDLTGHDREDAIAHLFEEDANPPGSPGPAGAVPKDWVQRLHG